MISPKGKEKHPSLFPYAFNCLLISGRGKGIWATSLVLSHCPSLHTQWSRSQRPSREDKKGCISTLPRHSRSLHWCRPSPSSQPAQQGCRENTSFHTWLPMILQAVRAGHSKQTAGRKPRCAAYGASPKSSPWPAPACITTSPYNTGSGDTGKASLEKVFGVVFVAGLPRALMWTSPRGTVCTTVLPKPTYLRPCRAAVPTSAQWLWEHGLQSKPPSRPILLSPL